MKPKGTRLVSYRRSACRYVPPLCALARARVERNKADSASVVACAPRCGASIYVVYRAEAADHVSFLLDAAIVLRSIA